MPQKLISLVVAPNKDVFETLQKKGLLVEGAKYSEKISAEKIAGRRVAISGDLPAKWLQEKAEEIYIIVIDDAGEIYLDLQPPVYAPNPTAHRPEFSGAFCPGESKRDDKGHSSGWF